MKRQVLIAVVLLSLASVALAAQGQPRQRFSADSGVVTLGVNQVLRFTIAGGIGDADLYVQFRRIEYMPGACNGGVCKHTLASQTTSGPIQLFPGEAASMDIPNTGLGVRGIAVTNRGTARVTIQVIDSTTGNIVSFKEATLDLQ